MCDLFTLYVCPKAAQMSIVEGFTYAQIQTIIKALPVDCGVMVFNQREKRMVFSLCTDYLSDNMGNTILQHKLKQEVY